MAKELKYQTFLKEFLDCPPPQCYKKDQSVFRWVFQNVDHPNNFTPVLLIDPKRLNSKQFDLESAKCSGYALSMFDSQSNAKNVYQSLIERNKNFGNVVGEYVAEIEIKPAHGIGTEPSKDNFQGHFDFFEFIDTIMSDLVIKIEKLIP